MPRALTLGELLVDFVATTEDVPLEEAPGFLRAPGGAPANVAAGLAKLGVPAGFIGKVGDDPFGRFLRRVMAEVGVDISRTLVAPGRRTALAFIANWSNGKKDICFYRHPGADQLLEPDEMDEDYLAAADVFHFGSVSLSHAPARQATIHAAHLARKAGALISYDPNLRLGLWDSPDEAREWIWYVMDRAHVVKLAEEEWEFITGTDSLSQGSRDLLDQGALLVIATRGALGCYFNNGTAEGYVEGFRANTIEPLGAGDAFVAAVLAQLLASEEHPLTALEAADEARLRGIMRYANAAGALTTEKMGVIPALPTAEQVEAALRERWAAK